MGSHKYYMDHLEPLMDGVDCKSMGPIQLLGGGRTENFKWMQAAGEYIRTGLYGDIVSHGVSVSRVQALSRREREIGHMTTEMAATDPHENFHLVSHAAIAYFADKFKDEATLTQQRFWLNDHFALYEMYSLPEKGNEVAIPGTRCETSPPLWLTHTAFVRQVIGGRQDEVYYRNLKNKSRDWRGVWMVDRLLKQGIWKPNKVTAVPKLAYPITKRAVPGGYAATAKGMPVSELNIVSVVKTAGGLEYTRATGGA